MRKKRQLERDATVEGLHRLLAQARYDEMLAAPSAAVQRFPSDPEVRLMHGTALSWSRPEEAALELATAVSLDKNNPWLVVALPTCSLR